jgi:hypothetical protein
MSDGCSTANEQDDDARVAAMITPATTIKRLTMINKQLAILTMLAKTDFYRTGFRNLTHVAARSGRLMTRNGHDRAGRFPLRA